MIRVNSNTEIYVCQFKWFKIHSQWMIMREMSCQTIPNDVAVVININGCGTYSKLQQMRFP